MEPLQTEYQKGGFAYIVIKREGLAVIAEQRDDETGRLIAYEVYEVQQLPDQLVGPKKYPKPAREVPPGNEKWGDKGWSCGTLEAAEERFQALLVKLKNRELNKK